MPQGADAYVQIPVDSTGKRLDMEASTVASLLVYRERVIPYQSQMQPGFTTLLNQAAPAINTTYTASAASLGIDGFNAYTLVVEASGTGSTNVWVKVYPSLDGVTAFSKPIDAFVVRSPRSGVKLEGVVNGLAGAIPYLIVKVTTEATAPSTSIVVKFNPWFAASVLPSAVSQYLGSAATGSVRGGYLFASRYMEAAPALNNGVMMMWNPATTGVDVLLDYVEITAAYMPVGGGGFSNTNLALELIRVSADRVLMTAATAEPTDTDFSTALATYRAEAAGETITTSGTPLLSVTLPLSDNHAHTRMDFGGLEEELVVIRPGSGVAWRTPTALTVSTHYAINMRVRERLN
jgi:hypothetical protein